MKFLKTFLFIYCIYDFLIMWSGFDEATLNKMKEDINNNGDHLVNFNGTVGPLSILIEATEFVKSML